MDIAASARTDCGPVRENNEDALLLDHDNLIFIVADGMGGHAAGEVASRMAVDTIHELLLGQQDPEETRLVRNFQFEDTSSILRERLRYAFNQASISIRKTADEHTETRGMGTTAVALVLDGAHAHLAHVGDSRAYLCRDGQLQRLTRDHTVVQQEIDAGRLTPELARLLPHRNILTQSIGFQGPVEPDTATRVVQPGDRFLLCTDGLTDVLTDAALNDLMGRGLIDDLAESLVEAALTAHASDNITVVCVEIR
jgi:protein phosphatase